MGLTIKTGTLNFNGTKDRNATDHSCREKSGRGQKQMTENDLDKLFEKAGNSKGSNGVSSCKNKGKRNANAKGKMNTESNIACNPKLTKISNAIWQDIH